MFGKLYKSRIECINLQFTATCKNLGLDIDKNKKTTEIFEVTSIQLTIKKLTTFH